MRVAFKLLCVLVVLVAGVTARSSKLYPGFLASQQAANLHETLQQRPFGNAPTHGPVLTLPGYGPVKQTQFAGYIGLNDTDGSQLWYWFIAADAPNWKQMPTVAWYQGGPGGSSLYGWFQENISPYGMTQDLRLTDNPNSWTRVANIICIDNPVGVGFSYTESGQGYRTTEEQIGQDMDAFYVAFFNRYPFLSGGLYLTGESYAGKYIPAFGTAIHNNNQGREFQVPLLGMAIGDGWTEPSQQSQAYIPQARALALIDENQAAAAQVQADLCSAAIAKGDFAGALTPCNAVMGVITAAAGSTLDMYDVRVWNNPTPDVPLMAYLGQPSVMSALYANHAWASTSGDAANALNNDLFKPILSDMPTLLENYRVFIYNGNFDMVCGALGVERIYYNLEWAGQAAWQNASRSIWTTPLDNKGNFMYSGYVRQIEGFNVTQIIVAGAGHMVPMDQPVASLDMISRLVRGSWD